MAPILMAIHNVARRSRSSTRFTLKLQISGERFGQRRIYSGSYLSAYVLVFIMTATLYALPYGKGLNMRKAKYTRHAHTGTDNGKTMKRNYRAVLLRG